MKKNYQKIKEACKQAQIIVVSKTRSNQEIMEYYQLGVRDFGENRVEECVKKAIVLPKDIRWHFIGHLQRNKVKALLPYVAMIHSVESMDLLKVIEKEAAKINLRIPVLIQFNIANEKTKTGIPIKEAIPFMDLALNYQHVEIKGMMCMGPHVEDEAAIDAVFQQAYRLKQQLNEHYPTLPLNELSMGMSHDWPLALKNGATYLRIGTILFEQE